MSADFVREFAEARETLEVADEAFEGPLSRCIIEGPDEVLRRTEITQPAVLAASIAIYRVIAPRLPSKPSFFAGHSLGEYTALVAAGALPFPDAIRLVRRRGALMQEAVPDGEGAMAAVLGLSSDDVRSICDQASGVWPANYNSPTQTVIAGETNAVEEMGDQLLEAGAKRVMPLEVSAPFHSPLMQPAADALVSTLREAAFTDPSTPVISNVTGVPYDTAAEARTLLHRQICAPVRWQGSVQALVERGVSVQLEVGPGSVLTGLAGRIERGLARANISNVAQIEPALVRVREALG